MSRDENTQFFHAAANCQARRNKIRVLVQDGVDFFDNTQKLRLATDYFKAILGQPANSLDTVDVGSLYTPLDLSELTAEFSWAEIVQAINYSPNNRSPGPDGFTNEFHKSFKLLIKDDLLRSLMLSIKMMWTSRASTLLTLLCCQKKIHPWRFVIIGQFP